jgi:hypothetical protein
MRVRAIFRSIYGEARLSHGMPATREYNCAWRASEYWKLLSVFPIRSADVISSC